MNRSFYIGNKKVGEDCDPFVIAEAGINHNGDIEVAKQMVEIAANSGVDAVKFQTFRTEEFLADKSIPYTYKSQGKEITESMFEMFKRTELSKEEWSELKRFCDMKGVVFLSTPVSESDLDFLISLGASAVKMGSDDFTNLPLMANYSKRGLPMLVSSGMGNEDEMSQAVQTVSVANQNMCLFLCTSQYPTPAKDVNAKKLLTMRRKFPDIVLGFSDHTQGTTAAVLAVAYGAKVFEKHFTLNHDMPGPDQWFSSDPVELQQWVAEIREANKMLGCGDLIPTRAEQKMRGVMRRSIVALKDISFDEVFTEENIGLRRPGIGMRPELYSDVLGRHATRNISADTLIKPEDIK